MSGPVDVLARCADLGIEIDGFGDGDFGWVSAHNEQWGYETAEAAAHAALANVGSAS